jgi:hypothetical protein
MRANVSIAAGASIGPFDPAIAARKKTWNRSRVQTGISSIHSMGSGVIVTRE